MDRDVAREICTRLAAPEVEERFPRAPAEHDIGGQCDRDVEVEDLLREPLVRVLGRVVRDQRDRRDHQAESERRRRREAVIP